MPITYRVAFFAEKEVNGLMEELFETVSNALRVRGRDGGAGCPAGSVLRPPALPAEGGVTQHPVQPSQGRTERQQSFADNLRLLVFRLFLVKISLQTVHGPQVSFGAPLKLAD